MCIWKNHVTENMEIQSLSKNTTDKSPPREQDFLR